MVEQSIIAEHKIIATRRASEIRKESVGISNEKLKKQLRAEGHPPYTLEYASCMG